jgi:YVTN family beta-propeller protein
VIDRPTRQAERRARIARRRRHAVRGIAAIVTLIVAAVVWAVATRGHTAADAAKTGATSLQTTKPKKAGTVASARARKNVRANATATRLAEHPAGRLPFAIQDPAAVALDGGGIALLAGLSAADLSLNEALIVHRGHSRSFGQLPHALHDAPGVRLGGTIYVFGGGDAVGQLSGITGIDLSTGSTHSAGKLPAASSDSAATGVGGTAYVVGGFDGTHWLDTIVAWRPGTSARVVAHLPFAVRYAAVTTVGRLVVIAGGSLANGSASSAVLTFDPRSRAVRRVGTLPQPTTHAAAAAIGPIVYVIGGRGAATNTPTARIVSIDPRTGRIRAAGALGVARSDLAAVNAGNAILVAGGHATTGTQTLVTLLKPVTVSTRSAADATTLTVGARAVSVYAHDGSGMLTGAARTALPRIYVPNSQSNTVDVIDPATYKVVAHYAVGSLPQHVTPSWDLKTLYVDNDVGNSLTPIDPKTAKPKGPVIPVTDPYNLYFTPDGRSAIVVAERLARLDFRNPHSFRLQRSLSVPCRGVDHMDFTADGRFALASCEFSAQLVRIDLRTRRVAKTIGLHPGSMPQDVKLAPDGRIFYVADMMAGGLWEISASKSTILGFIRTGAGAHGLYPSRDSRYLYASNRNAGTVSVISFRTHRVVRTWRIPHGTPDMGGVSADGRVLWLSGRYSQEVYAIDTRSGHLLARIPVGSGPHGLSVWPQPGRYSLGHTGILR